ncbi:GNAT family N-acetyltransferase [Streptomyces sp. NPDC006879]|uniref:GNAT family N-acetyltransferase n=1 Tax=Streptomyces sp. NPDC006879 TaxID=3364767 RepID=UPI0036A1BB18
MITDAVEMRPVRPGDAAALAQALRRNREFLRPFEPYRPEWYYTERGQRERIEGLRAEVDAGLLAPYVLVEAGGGQLLGCITLGRIVRGPLSSGGIGYWIDQGRTRRGLATAAVLEMCRIAREDLALHRVEAGTLLDNLASQRVLTKAGFEPYGTAPQYLHIDGAWRDHRLFQRILHDRPPA